MFMRTRRLFLRPIWPEDQADAAVTDVATIAAAAHPRFPCWLVTSPDHHGGPVVIGHVWLNPAERGAAIGCHIAPGQRRRGFGAEALRAAAAMAQVLGHGRLVAAGAIEPATARMLARAGFRLVAGAAWELDLTVANHAQLLGSAA